MTLHGLGILIWSQRDRAGRSSTYPPSRLKTNLGSWDHVLDVLPVLLARWPEVAQTQPSWLARDSSLYRVRASWLQPMVCSICSTTKLVGLFSLMKVIVPAPSALIASMV